MTKPARRPTEADCAALLRLLECGDARSIHRADAVRHGLLPEFKRCLRKGLIA